MGRNILNAGSLFLERKMSTTSLLYYATALATADNIKMGLFSTT